LSNNHSEGAKCYLLIAKICLAKGQLKRSFRNIERAYEILKNALVKMDTQEYNNIFMNHPYYMDISIQKVKIFNRQLKHDLALKELQISKKIAKLKVEHLHSRTVLATIYEEQAAILICLGETVSFEEYLTKAISIREEEIGKFNIPNAISYSNLYKYLRVLNDAEDALAYHHKAVEIFARFPSDHPNAWIIHLSNGLYFF
jgi:tetratricopeptide (TPR) repeat protein